MPDDTASNRFSTPFSGIAVASKVPSSIPILVVPQEAMNGATGPVPVVVEHGGRAIQAWAWSEHAWDRTSTAREPSKCASELTFSLSRLTAEELRISDQLGKERCPLTVHVPVPVPIIPVMPLVHDPPESDEVQVPHGFLGFEGRAVLIRNGVAASVAVTARDHVRPGTVRISTHLRTITDPTADGPESKNAVLLRPPHLGPAGTAIPTHSRVLRRLTAKARTTLQASVERALRRFFRAEEQAMRVVYAHSYDEHQYAVSMTDAALLRLGVQAGDKAVLNWLGAEIEVTVLQDHEPAEPSVDGNHGHHDPTKPGLALGMSSHLAVRVPTALRHVVRLPAASTVTVRRSTRSVLARNLNNLIIPVASLALAGAALNDPNWWILGLGAVATALLGLSRLRMSSRRAVLLGRGR